MRLGQELSFRGEAVGVALWDTLRLLFLVEAIGIFWKGSNIIWFTF